MNSLDHNKSAVQYIIKELIWRFGYRFSYYCLCRGFSPRQNILLFYYFFHPFFVHFSTRLLLHWTKPSVRLSFPLFSNSREPLIIREFFLYWFKAYPNTGSRRILLDRICSSGRLSQNRCKKWRRAPEWLRKSAFSPCTDICKQIAPVSLTNTARNNRKVFYSTYLNRERLLTSNFVSSIVIVHEENKLGLKTGSLWLNELIVKVFFLRLFCGRHGLMYFDHV